MAHKAKMKKKNKVQPCTSANQKAQERKIFLERKKNHKIALEKKREEAYRQRMEFLAQLEEAAKQQQLSMSENTPEYEAPELKIEVEDEQKNAETAVDVANA